MSDFAKLLKRGLKWGIAAECAAAGAAYLFYRKFTQDPEFKKQLETEYPEVYHSMIGIGNAYLKMVPERWRDKVLDSAEAPTDSTDPPK